MDLMLQLDKLTQDLNKSVKELRNSGENYANAYRKYRILVAQELLKLKSDGMPVTIASDIARGNEEVANAKFEEIRLEAIYKANLESINSLKIQIRVIENQITREYGRGE